MLDRPPVYSTIRHHVRLRARVRADAFAAVSFDDDEVREWAGLDEGEEVTPELVRDYAVECEDVDWDVDDIDDFDQVDVEWVRSEQTLVVPPSFVPLPGLEGEL